MTADDMLTRKEAATYLARVGCPVSARTLERLASDNNAGGGPPFTRVRWSRVFYRRADLMEWASQQCEKVA